MNALIASPGTSMPYPRLILTYYSLCMQMLVCVLIKAIYKKNNPMNRDVSFKLRCDGIALKPTTITSDL